MDYEAFMQMLQRDPTLLDQLVNMGGAQMAIPALNEQIAQADALRNKGAPRSSNWLSALLNGITQGVNTVSGARRGQELSAQRDALMQQILQGRRSVAQGIVGPTTQPQAGYSVKPPRMPWEPETL
jgi:hypothetical protein